jgi:hypothetical protein
MGINAPFQGAILGPNVPVLGTRLICKDFRSRARAGKRTKSGTRPPGVLLASAVRLQLCHVRHASAAAAQPEIYSNSTTCHQQ